ncbi:hypothetical protein [Chryseobacterium gleum]|uniref:hypothetical protein n=1 Tax=Chryseobacterium gleum TaxID=250 RepID=UPI0028A0B823|nr:hypothetical protein [Chryseobacterium gleum]
MKNLGYIILFCQLLLMTCCKVNGQSSNSIPNELIIGKVVKIDSTQSFYIINIEYDKNKKGVFLSQKNNCDYPKKRKLIKINNIYTFELSRLIQNNYKEKKIVYEVEGKETWNSSSGTDYFEYSYNTCGLYTWK